MSAMWTQTPGVNKSTYGYNADDRESASVAHIYGQNLAAAESMTAAAAALGLVAGNPQAHRRPGTLNGINRFVIHESAHQPLLDKAPGLTLGPFGQWFNRNETWAEQAGPWIDYLARSSYLLQQGRFAADVLYFYGEDSNLTAIFRRRTRPTCRRATASTTSTPTPDPRVPRRQRPHHHRQRHDYRLLALDPTANTCRCPCCAPFTSWSSRAPSSPDPSPPTTPASPTIRPSSEAQRRAVRRRNRRPQVGKGQRSTPDRTPRCALPRSTSQPDFDHTKPQPDTRIALRPSQARRRRHLLPRQPQRPRRDRRRELPRHRQGAGAVARRDRQVRARLLQDRDGRTTVPLHLEPWGTVFVVFRKPASSSLAHLPASRESQLATVDGPWTGELPAQPRRAASITLDTLPPGAPSDDRA
jgi:hypothetical protein